MVDADSKWREIGSRKRKRKLRKYLTQFKAAICADRQRDDSRKDLVASEACCGFATPLTIDEEMVSDRQSIHDLLRTQLTTESNVLRQQNLIGYLIANVKLKLREERES